MSKIVAESLSVSIPNKGCDKHCPYCISEITGPVLENLALMHRNAPTVVNIAKAAQVASVLFTSKGEPLLNLEDLISLASYFKDFRLELQTDGLELAKDAAKRHNVLPQLYEAGFNFIAVSINDNVKEFEMMENVFRDIKLYGMLPRLCVNIVKPKQEVTPLEILEYACKLGIPQLLIRHVSIPDGHEDSSKKEVAWILERNCQKLYHEVRVGIMQEVSTSDDGYSRILNDGTEVHHYKGLSIVFSDYCVQTVNAGTDIRSLVFDESGHLRDGWVTNSEILL